MLITETSLKRRVSRDQPSITQHAPASDNKVWVSVGGALFFAFFSIVRVVTASGNYMSQKFSCNFQNNLETQQNLFFLFLLFLENKKRKKQMQEKSLLFIFPI